MTDLESIVRKLLKKPGVAMEAIRSTGFDEDVARAKNGEVSADRFTTGTLRALVEIIAGGTHVSDMGIDLEILAQAASELGSNDTSLSSRISTHATAAGNRGSLSFYDDSAALERGVELLQFVNANSYAASLTLAAMRSGTFVTDDQNAYIYMVRNIGGGTGQMHFSGQLSARTMIDPQYRSGWLSIASGASRDYAHGFGSPPILVQVLNSASSDGSSPQYVPNTGGNVTFGAADATNISIANSGASTRFVRVVAWKDPYP